MEGEEKKGRWWLVREVLFSRGVCEGKGRQGNGEMRVGLCVCACAGSAAQRTTIIEQVRKRWRRRMIDGGDTSSSEIDDDQGMWESKYVGR